MPVIPSNDQDATNPDTSTHTPTLLDTLPLTRRINIFSSLLRDHPDLPSILSPPSNHKKDQQPANFTILAPLNSALQSLPHKPWEDSSDYATFGERAYDGQGGQDRAKGNLKKFVEAHVLPKSPWAQGEKVQTLAGKEVWWEEKSEKRRFIMPDEVEVDEVVSQAANGEIWVLKGALKLWGKDKVKWDEIIWFGGEKVGEHHCTPTTFRSSKYSATLATREAIPTI
jgi:Fasciclin domain